jgi:hypothetical protein
MILKDENVEVRDSIAQMSSSCDLHKKGRNTYAALSVRVTILL